MSSSPSEVCSILQGIQQALGKVWDQGWGFYPVETRSRKPSYSYGKAAGLAGPAGSPVDLRESLRVRLPLSIEFGFLFRQPSSLLTPSLLMSCPTGQQRA